MTLNTHVWLHGPIHGEVAFTLALQAILDAADRGAELDAVRVEYDDNGGWSSRCTGHDLLQTVPQGLPAWTCCWYRHDGSPVATDDRLEQFDARWHSEEDPPGIEQRKCQVEISWDTAYGYSERGIGCTELHARALVLLHSWLPEGVTLTWQNEFSGEIFDGLTGLEGFLGDGAKANDWYRNVAAPAIAAHIAAQGQNT
jgi:hypothetical protein